VYVINGIPYDTMELESALSNFDITNLVDAVYWNGKKHGQYPFYGDAAIIVFAHEQKLKSKRRALKSAKSLFNDNSNLPVLLINNSIIDTTISRITFQRIQLKEILYIDRIQFGEEERIRIWKTK